MIHEKCSNGIKDHLTGFKIENEYDLQKLMFSALSVVYPDARIEVVQDSGHHSLRKDIVIDSEAAVIELKCSRKGMTERSLSEEIASDIIHYGTDKLYFFIYDKEDVIANAVSFIRSYEEINVDGKSVRLVIYSHNDI